MSVPRAGPRVLVQYVVLRGDLSRAPLSWPLGALVAQACHAATAALHVYRAHPDTAAYLGDLGSMRKVVLEIPDEAALKALATHLQQESVDHTLWLEQPENTPTCLALRPYPKDEVNSHLRKLKLLK
ncbi:putative peptidyl-tRNA hydrolase PTRHD1 [Tachyglossus aculeatus]|uniref:putative peptidyl-tRNA hydrolase PTRHD1 n=1 Tax=Tachyglossus aculeatus TaxID=9261 RepID=UPI0018F52FA9|nr:putative peptidyl-tRNA hydrolase PTRHD1 [Tachyglossus aculeatus]